MTFLQNTVLLALVCACALPVPCVHAADYPTKSIRLIVPFVAGGGTDLLARLLSPRLSDILGQQVVVDNRGGAASVVGTQIVSKAAPDGYTLGVFDTAFAINPAFAAKLPYDSERDFVFIAIIATNPSVLVAHPGLKARTIPELIVLAKSNPGKIKFASAGYGSAAHLSGEMLKTAAKINIVHVPFKGAGAAIIDVLGGHTDLAFVVPGTVKQYVQAGTLIALGVTGNRSSPTLPNVPTFASVGLPTVDTESFRFVAAPSALPAPIQRKLTAALRTVMDAQEVQTRLADNGFDAAFLPHPEARTFIATEMQKWRQAVKDAGASQN